MIRIPLTTIAFALSPWCLSTAAAQTGPEQAFLQTCESEGRRLWGRSLCAPVVIVNPATGTYRTSAREPQVALPPTRANTAFSWGGETWIMVLEPLPADPAQLASLLFHEAWHAHQQALGYPPNNAVAQHLDEPVARYLIRLEWQALARALVTRGARQRRHIAQALAFRARRLGNSRDSAESERQQMRHEGIAAYTGVTLSGAPLRLALEALRGGADRPALGRSFAYVSGPAWGLLLDQYRPGWRQTDEPLGLAEAMPLQPAAIADPDSYGGTTILAEEMLAGLERRRRVEAAVAATSARSGLRLPLAQINLDFDPNRVSAAPDGSSIYHRITLGDRWGRIQVEGVGLRILPDYTAAYAPWPLPPDALELAPGWRVEERPEGGARLVESGR